MERVAILVPSVASALVIGLVQVSLAVSYAALVFSGDLEPFLARGIGFTLYAALAAGIAAAIFATVPGTVGNVKGVTAALIAVVAAGAARAVDTAAPTETIFATVIVTIALTSLTTGVFLLALGRFGLGAVVRYLPYPVVGGFLAGSGWLLVASSLQVLAGAPFEFSQLGAWLDPATFPRWSLALAFGLFLLLVMERALHPLVFPGVILLALVAFALGVWLSSTSFADLQRGGWLLGALPEGRLWTPLAWAEWPLVDWRAISTQWLAIGAVALVAAMEVLLNATGLEAVLRKEVRLNRELNAAGIGSIAAGAGGGMVGYQVLSLTVLAARTGGRNRVAGVLATGVAAAAMLGGGAALAMLPKFVLGGLTTYIGLQFLKTWLIDSWRSLPRVEYGIVLAIVLAIAFAGIVPGVMVGVLASVVLFAVAYGRIDVVRHELTGAAAGSRVTRSPRQKDRLARDGDAIRIVRLQGYLFFGSAHRVLAALRTHLETNSADAPRFVIADFRSVSGIDSTAARTLVSGVELAAKNGVELVFTHLADPVEKRLRFLAAERHVEIRRFADLDRGLEWCEDQLLRETDPRTFDKATLTSFGDLDLDPRLESRLLPYFERRHVAPGRALVALGDASDALYIVEAGALTAQIQRTDGSTLRLETVGAGRIVGELGFFLQQPRSASVVADAPSDVLVLDRAAFDRMNAEEPVLARELHRAIARLLSERVTHLMRVVRALEG